MRVRSTRLMQTSAAHLRDATLYLLLFLQFTPGLGILTGSVDTTAQNVGTDSSAITAASGSILAQLVIIAFFAASAVFAKLAGVRFRVLFLAVTPLIPLVLLAILSLGWSEYPFLTLRRTLRASIELSAIILFALSIAQPTTALRVLFRTFFIINLMDIASIAFPYISFTPLGFAGIHLHKNLAGLFFFLGLPVFGIGILDRSVSTFRTAAAFAFSTGGAMLILTLSKSAAGAAIISVTLVALTRIIVRRNSFSRIALPLIVILSIASLVLIISSQGISTTLDFLFGDATLTGRDQIWHYALLKLDENPWLGTGYGALWQIGPNVEESLKNSGAHWLASQAHNGYIDILAQLGYIGFLCLTIFLVMTLARILKYISRYERNRLFGLGDYALYVFWGSVVYNVTESSYFRTGHSMWFMLIFISACAARRESAKVAAEASRRLAPLSITTFGRL
jgi:exopolysaccharide production protein ExoQ